jgi:hypothetical protein
VGTSSSSPIVRPSSGRHRQHDVAVADPVRAEHAVVLDHAGGRAGHVVLVGTQQPGVLGRLAAEQGAAGLGAGLGEALDHGGDPFGQEPAAGDVVGHEQGLGAADHQVVDHHAHQVEADRVVHVQGLGDRHLGPHAVGGGGQHGVPHPGQR